MARSQTRLALLLILVMLIAGCVSEPTPDWGTDDGEIKVTLKDGKAEIISKLGTEDYDKEGIPLEQRKKTVFSLLPLYPHRCKIYEERTDKAHEHFENDSLELSISDKI